LNRRSHSSPFFVDAQAKLALVVTAAVWIVVVFGGGSSRADVPWVLAVRLAAICGLGLLLVAVPPQRLRLQRWAVWLAAACALLIGLQLVPLPPGIWTSLPGREPYVRLGELAGIGELWRPMSLAPDLTWNALVALVAPMFFIVALPILGVPIWRWILAGLLVTIVLSGVLGMLQMAGGPDTPLRWYPVTNANSAVGFFANRNHQATFLAMGVPLAVWWAVGERRAERLNARLAIAGSIVLFLLAAAVMTQSRMGAVVLALSLILSTIYLFTQIRVRGATLFWLAAGALLAVGVASAAFTTWAESRLAVESATGDTRLRILDESIETMQAFFPIGAGFGTFPQVFRRFESDEDLTETYANHTHSEITELLIEGGIFPVILFLVFLAWFLVSAKRVWWGGRSGSEWGSQGRLCTILIALPLVASITDYPLRTPLMACAMMVAAMFLADRGREPQDRGRG
jgi:hypothetical protein